MPELLASFVAVVNPHNSYDVTNQIILFLEGLPAQFDWLISGLVDFLKRMFTVYIL
ncbi:MAG: hypothetical protein LBJ12_09665 [Oscillospiraceae bacterium]|jgi:hypothetical protein|nr:hypothetical protein [Oscillospiraceae bacterium]